MNDFSEEDDSLLVVIIDTNPFIWGKRAQSRIGTTTSTTNTTNGHHSTSDLDFSTFLEHTFVFINAYLMLRHQNQLAIIASHVGESKFLFPKPALPSKKDKHKKDDKKESKSEGAYFSDFSEIKNQILIELRALSSQTMSSVTGKDDTHSMFSGALSLALCYINRMVKERVRIKPRILLLQVSPDTPPQYIPVMNCIFSAQKQFVPVDSCILSNSDSSFLQQASHLTGGIYVRPHHQEGLLEYLLSCFLADQYTRKFINLPTLTRVDYRASCFCHKKVIDMGFVCSVCLSIFCSFRPTCSTCEVKFVNLPKLPPLPKKKPAAPPVKQEPKT